MSTRTGQFYCGTLRYEIMGDFAFIVNCHCRTLRRVSGTEACTREENFSISACQEEIREYFPKVTGPSARMFRIKCNGRLTS